MKATFLDLAAFRPLYVACKLCGLMPFRMNLRTLAFRQSALDLVYPSLLIFLQLIFLIMNVEYLLRSEKIFSIKVFDHAIMRFTAYATSLTFIIQDMRKGAEIYQRVVNVMVQCNQLTLKCQKNSHAKIKIILLTELLIGACFSLTPTIGFLATLKIKELRVHIVLFVPVLLTSLVGLLRFANLMLLLRYMLKTVNNGLANLREEMVTVSNVSADVKRHKICCSDCSTIRSRSCCVCYEQQSYRNWKPVNNIRGRRLQYVAERGKVFWTRQLEDAVWQARHKKPPSVHQGVIGRITGQRNKQVTPYRCRPPCLISAGPDSRSGATVTDSSMPVRQFATYCCVDLCRMSDLCKMTCNQKFGNVAEDGHNHYVDSYCSSNRDYSRGLQLPLANKKWETAELPLDQKLGQERACCPQSDVIRRLRTAHGRVCLLGHDVLGAHAVPAVLSLVSFLAHALHSAISATSGEAGALSHIGSLLFFWYVGLGAADVLVMIVPAQAANTEASRSARLVQRLLVLAPVGGALHQQLTAFGSQLVHARPPLGTCGPITLDFHLFVSVVSAFTTGIAILTTFK